MSLLRNSQMIVSSRKCSLRKFQRFQKSYVLPFLSFKQYALIRIKTNRKASNSFYLVEYKPYTPEGCLKFDYP